MSWRRGQAYAQHLRDRVLATVDRGMRAYEAAEVFQGSVSWIYKALARRRETGESTARPQVNQVPPKLLRRSGSTAAGIVTRRCAWPPPLSSPGWLLSYDRPQEVSRTKGVRWPWPPEADGSRRAQRS
jgi:hypothetical protein